MAEAAEAVLEGELGEPAEAVLVDETDEVEAVTNDAPGHEAVTEYDEERDDFDRDRPAQELVTP